MGEYEEIKAQCLAAGQLFEDADFDAVTKSVYFRQTSAKWSGVEWKRPGELCDSPQFHVDGTTRFDLDQGALGNCWFISAAAILATKKELFDQVVPPGQTYESEYAGVFWFRFWRFGRWMDVVVDDRLPCKGGKLLFCKNRENPNEFWSALMEKAFAKIHGCYQALDAGYSHDALVDFTGGIGEFIDLEYGVPPNLFPVMNRIFKMGSMICGSINVKEGSSYEDKLDNGLVTGHTYSLTNIVKLTVGDVVHKLLRLRNPWGCREWNGPWSDGSQEWNTISDDQKTQFDLTIADDGEFWIPYEDFIANFHTVQICHLTPSTACGGKTKSEWIVKSYHGSWVAGVNAGGCGNPNKDAFWINPQYFVRLQDVDEGDEETKCTLVVSLIQKFRRQMKTILQTVDGQDHPVAVDVFRFPGDEPEVLDGQQFDQSQFVLATERDRYEYLRERSGRFKLDPGLYCIIPSTFAEGTEAEFLMRIATEKPASSGEVDGASEQVPVQQQTKPLPQAQKFTRLYEKFAGEDEIVDARELRKILNKAFKQDQDEDFSKETCRSLISWAAGKGGTADTEECKKIWREVLSLKGFFGEFDQDSSGELDKKELRQALRSLGFRFSRNLVATVANTYCGKAAGLTLDDFILVAIKTKVQFDKYQAAVAEGSVSMPLTEWLETTLVG